MCGGLISVTFPLIYFPLTQRSGLRLQMHQQDSMSLAFTGLTSISVCRSRHGSHSQRLGLTGVFTNGCDAQIVLGRQEQIE